MNAYMFSMFCYRLINIVKIGNRSFELLYMIIIFYMYLCQISFQKKYYNYENSKFITIAEINGVGQVDKPTFHKN
jgi:uncharacterized membrane protein YesL